MPISPGQWAPWISDPDPPEEPMSEEESKAAAQKAMALMRKPWPRRSEEELRAAILKQHPTLTSEELEDQLKNI